MPPAPSRHQVIVYSRSGCPLCDEALSTLHSLADELSLTITVEDISTSPDLESRYATSIPVIFVDNYLAFKGHVDPTRLRRRLGARGFLARLSARLSLPQADS